MNDCLLYGIPFIAPKKETELGIKGLGKLSNNDVYDMVTKRIIDEIENNDKLRWEIGWSDNKSVKEYKDLLPFPINFKTNRYYRGINAFLLSYYPKKNDKGITVFEPILDERLYWLTFKQIQQAGGRLKKGSVANTAVYYNFMLKYDNEIISEERYIELENLYCGVDDDKSIKECSKLEKIPFLKYYNVFNERDIEGIDFAERRKQIQEKYKTFIEKRAKIEAAELVVKHMPQRPVIKERKLSAGESPYYSPSKDIVVVPLREQYKDLGVFYGTLFHELTHSTGAKKRLARSGIVDFEGYGSESYAFEELIAELGAAFLNAESGVLLSTLKKNSAYIKGWKEVVSDMLKKDNKAIFKAAGQAQKAADFILNKDKNGVPAFYKDLEKKISDTDKEKRIRIAKVKAKAKLKLLKLLDTGKTSQTKKAQKPVKPQVPTKSLIQEMPVKNIYTDEKRFQNRINAFSEESKNRIINAVKNGTFDWAKFDAIIIWLDPKQNKFFVLSGHSRLAAFKELAKTNKDFKNIPVKIFEGTEKQAIETALTSNTLSTKETDIERAIYYANKRKSCEINLGLNGLNRCEKEVIAEAKEAEGCNANYIINLSYLNPNGFLMDNLMRAGIDKDNDSTNVLRIIANWIGEARKNNPELLDIHEIEIAKYLLNGGYGNKKGQFKNKAVFNERLKYSFEKWKAAGADPAKPLNLANTLSKTAHEKDFEKRLEEAKKALDAAIAEHKEKHDKFLLALINGEITQERLDELMKPYVANVKWHQDELKRIKGQKAAVEKASKAQGTLFGLDKQERMRIVKEKAATKLKLLSLPIDVAKSDLDFERARRAYYWISFDPEKRAEQEQDSYVAAMIEFNREFSSDDYNDMQQSVFIERFKKYKEFYLSSQLSILDAKSQTASIMITGGSNFDASRNKRKLDIERGRYEDFLLKQEKFLRNTRKMINDAMIEDERERKEWLYARKFIDERIGTIIMHDSGDIRVLRSHYVNLISGYIERLARNGKAELVKNLLDYIRNLNKEIKKPIFTNRHKVWKFELLAKQVQQEKEKNKNEKKEIQFKGGVLIINNEADRLQFFFDEKPDEAVRTILKKSAFRWSPKNKAWQRKITRNALSDAKQFILKYYN